MSDVPAITKDNAYMVGVSGLATFYGPWVDCSKARSMSFNLAWTAVAATAGTLSIEGTNDDAQAVTGTAGTNVTTLTIGTYHGTYPTVSTSAANCMVIVEPCPKWVRIVYTRSAGGGAGQFTGRVFGRSS